MWFKPETTASVNGNILYVTGVGTNCDEIWKYCKESKNQEVFEWVKCAKMKQGRRGHCQAFLGSCLFMCGGYSDDKKQSVLNSIEKYEIYESKSSLVENCKLEFAVRYSACVAYKDSVYIFGGSDSFDKNVDYMQVFNPAENTCFVMSHMPREYRLMEAAVWENMAIILGRYNCFVYEFDTEVWHERILIKTEVHQFGMVLENQKIYVIGGGKDVSEHEWKSTNTIKCIDVKSIINNELEPEWKPVSLLPSRCFVHVCGALRLPARKV